jgi:hypothetical protein
MHADDYLRPGDDYTSIEERLADRVESDERALYVMVRASVICQSALKPGWRSRVKKARYRGMLSLREAFCGGRVTHDDLQFYSYKMLEGHARRHPENVEVDDGVQPIYDWVLDSDSPDDSELASFSVAIPVMGAWEFAREEVAGTPYATKLPRYQQVALQGLLCADVGGCDARGVNTMTFCLLNEACTPGLSLDDMWSDEFAPAELEIISRIQQRIVDERSRRAEARASAR